MFCLVKKRHTDRENLEFRIFLTSIITTYYHALPNDGELFQNTRKICHAFYKICTDDKPGIDFVAAITGLATKINVNKIERQLPTNGGTQSAAKRETKIGYKIDRPTVHYITQHSLPEKARLFHHERHVFYSPLVYTAASSTCLAHVLVFSKLLFLLSLSLQCTDSCHENRPQ